MSRTAETGLWKWLRDGRPSGCLLHRIENSVDSGTPDVIGTIYSQIFWMELKVAESAGGKRLKLPHLTADQASFLRRWQAAGTPSSVLVQFGQGRAARRFLVPARWAHCMLDEPFTFEWIESVSLIEPDANPEEVMHHAAFQA